MALILMFCDEQDACMLMQRMLTISGHKVRAFTDAHEALLWLQINTPELALLDLKFRSKTGWLVLEFIRLHRPRTKVLVVTGNPSADIARRASELGIEDCLVKPVEIEELEVHVNRALRLDQ